MNGRKIMLLYTTIALQPRSAPASSSKTFSVAKWRRGSRTRRGPVLDRVGHHRVGPVEERLDHEPERLPAERQLLVVLHDVRVVRAVHDVVDERLGGAGQVDGDLRVALEEVDDPASAWSGSEWFTTRTSTFSGDDPADVPEPPVGEAPSRSRSGRSFPCPSRDRSCTSSRTPSG